MSYSTTVDIHCDSCGIWMLGSRGIKVARLAAARAMAVKSGWLVFGLNHYCPQCRIKKDYIGVTTDATNGYTTPS